MSASLKVYGILFLVVILTIAIIDFQRTTIVDDDIFNATRNSQLSIIEESIEWGELIVNDHLSINQMYANQRFIEIMQANTNLQTQFEIKLLHIINAPPLMGVKVDYVADNKLLNDVNQSYSNVVILERR